jgi:hypothetical protein
MKSVARFSAWVILAGVLCFVPCAVGQGSASNRSAGSGDRVLNYVPASLLAFVSAPSSDRSGHHDRGGNGGCDSQSAGRDKGSWGGGDGCTAVPEGGTAVTYLLLAGVFCLGAMLWRSRRQAAVRETK